MEAVLLYFFSSIHFFEGSWKTIVLPLLFLIGGFIFILFLYKKSEDV